MTMASYTGMFDVAYMYAESVHRERKRERMKERKRERMKERESVCV